MGKNKGYVSIYRDLQEHYLWRDRPFAKGQAWIDLIMLANYTEVKDLKDGMLCAYEKGTVYRSISELATRWGWDRRKVKRFLMALKSDGMLSVNSTTQGTTLTIVNYGFYQHNGTTNGT